MSRITLGYITRLALLQSVFFSSVCRKRVPADRPGWSGHGATGYDIDYGTLDIRLWVKELSLVLVKVLSGVGGLVFEAFHKLVESRGYESAQQRTNPVDLRDIQQFGRGPRNGGEPTQ